MVTSRNTERVRFRYGICLNDNCSKCKSKEVQEISARKELVCAECGKPLHECPPPKKSSRLGLIIGIAVVVVVACAIGAYFLFFRTAPKEETTEDVPEVVQEATDVAVEAQPTDSIKEDSVSNGVEHSEEQKDSSPVISKTETRVNTPTSQSKSSPAPIARNSVETMRSGSINLGYGTYSGEMSAGVPHGQGKIVYSRQTIISKYDPKKRTAEAGEYVQGQFVNGYPTIVRHYDASGHLIETLNLGVD